jgi:hypothetical protein
MISFNILFLTQVIFTTIIQYTMPPSHSIDNLSGTIPKEISSWREIEENIYNRKNLHEFINGGAELYLSYGFQSVLSRVYESEDEPALYLDIFDMGNSKNAFGVFSHTREFIQSDFGQGSQYTKGLLLFWKDRYLISLLISPETPAGKKVIRDLAELIDQVIDKAGSLPEIISLLPESNLKEESIRYFRHYIWLNSHYFIADTNIFNITDDTEVVLAKYKGEDKSAILLLLLYPDKDSAITAKQSFKEKYLDDSEAADVMKTEDGLWVGWKQENRLLSVVFQGQSGQICTDLLNEVEKKQKQLKSLLE